MGLDMDILVWIQEDARDPVSDAVMTFITHTGDFSAVWAALGILFLIRKETREMGIALLLALLVCHLMNDMALKPLFERPRPSLANPGYEPLVHASGHSFPSGHAAKSFAAAGAILLCDRKAGMPALFYAGLIAFSRMYVFVHYLSDVAAGALVGMACAVLIFHSVKIVRTRARAGEGIPGGE